MAAARFPHHDKPKGDVPDHVAFARVSRDDVVVELLQLPDIVEDGTCKHKVGVGAVMAGKSRAPHGSR